MESCMFQQGKRIQNLNEDHQGTHLLLNNHLLRSERRNLDVDGHLGIINSRIDRRRRDVASLEQRLDDLEAANALLTAKVTAMEPRLCRCGREEQMIVVEDGEREESSPSSYQTPPVASPDENQEPIPVRIATMREGQLVPVVEQEEIDELFRAIDRERDSQEELSVCSPNRQRRRLWVRRRAQLHAMSTAVDVQPRVPLRRINVSWQWTIFPYLSHSFSTFTSSFPFYFSFSHLTLHFSLVQQAHKKKTNLLRRRSQEDVEVKAERTPTAHSHKESDQSRQGIHPALIASSNSPSNSPSSSSSTTGNSCVSGLWFSRPIFHFYLV